MNDLLEFDMRSLVSFGNASLDYKALKRELENLESSYRDLNFGVSFLKSPIHRLFYGMFAAITKKEIPDVTTVLRNELRSIRRLRTGLQHETKSLSEQYNKTRDYLIRVYGALIDSIEVIKEGRINVDESYTQLRKRYEDLSGKKDKEYFEVEREFCGALLDHNGVEHKADLTNVIFGNLLKQRVYVFFKALQLQNMVRNSQRLVAESVCAESAAIEMIDSYSIGFRQHQLFAALHRSLKKQGEAFGSLDKLLLEGQKSQTDLMNRFSGLFDKNADLGDLVQELDLLQKEGVFERAEVSREYLS